MEGTKLYTQDANGSEAPDVDKIASNAWLKAGELFPKTLDLLQPSRIRSLLPIFIRSMFEGSHHYQ